MSGAYAMLLIHPPRRRNEPWLAHWNLSPRSALRFDPNKRLLGDVNQFHRQKATLAAAPFDYFLILLGLALSAVNDGSAFDHL